MACRRGSASSWVTGVTTLAVEFLVIGQVEARVDGRLLDLGHARRRSLLCVLLVEANRSVPTDQLMERAWGDRLPRRTHDTLYSYLSRLRRVLRDADGVELTWHSGGYRLSVDPAMVDYHRFGELIRAARATAPGEQAMTLFERALGLWRGDPFGDLDTPWVNAERSRLESERFAAELDHADCALRAGSHAAVLPDLAARAAAYPLDERVAGQLVLALYRCGRQADALAHYQQTRRRLADELGTDPGPPLERLHQQVLRGDAVVAEAVREVRQRSEPVSMLPADIADFIGRDKLLAGIAGSLTTPDSTAERGAVPVIVLAGRAGVGKTTLAIHAAHRIASHFADGQLYLDLRGADPNPVDPRLVLGRFLRSMGVDGSAIPHGLDERAELFRGLLAGRRVLVVLDNAAGSAQVKPLIPGVSSCGVLVTARSRLPELSGAELVDVDPPGIEDGISLLARIVGSDRVSGEPDAAERIVRLCGNLPLAVRIAGARLARRTHWRLIKLVDRLSDQQRRLDELVVGDLDVRASFALSYEALPAESARVLRLLALLDAPNFAAWVAAALLQVDTDQAEELVEALVEAYLVDVVGDVDGHPRYGMHDLVRLYARERSDVDDTEEDRHAALTNAFDAWLGLARQADARLPNRRLSPVHAADPRPTNKWVHHIVDPLAWFVTERANLMAVVDQAARADMSELAWDVAACCANFLDLRDLHDDWNRAHQTALAACQRSGDRLGEAVALRGLGDLASITPQFRTGDYFALTARARELFRECGERSAEVDTLVILGNLHRMHGEGKQARSCLQDAAALMDDGVHPATQTIQLLERGFIEQELGHYDHACTYAYRCLELAEANGWRVQQADALQLLGSLHDLLDRPAEAVEHLTAALAIAIDLDHGSMQAWISCVLGGRYLRLQQHANARAALDRSAELFDQLGITNGKAAVLRWRGELALAVGEPRQAIAHLQSCLQLSRAHRAPYLEAYTLKALGTADYAEGNHSDALDHWRQARDIFARIGNHAEASKTEQLLGNALGNAQPSRIGGPEHGTPRGPDPTDER